MTIAQAVLTRGAMAYTDEELTDIYDRTSGYCHLCHKKLAFTNYGRFGERGAWEVEHSNARRNGGTDRACNCFPACISCNRSKGAGSTRTARAHNGRRRAPMNRTKRREARENNAFGGAAIGGFAGAILGPVGSIAGAAIGARLAYKQNPDKAE